MLLPAPTKELKLGDTPAKRILSVLCATHVNLTGLHSEAFVLRNLNERYRLAG